MIDIDALHRRIEKLEKQLERARHENKQLRDSTILARKRMEEAVEGCHRWHAENAQLKATLQRAAKKQPK